MTTPPRAAPKAWPAEAVELRPVKSLLPYARNARTHSPEQVSQIAAAIEEYGFTVPLLVDEASEIIAGHGRLLAAVELGLARIPVMVARGWTPAQKRAYRIWDNQSGLLSEWDAGLLKVEIADLKAGDYNLDLLGFPELQLVEFMSGLGNGAGNRQSGMGSLAEKFGVPPFSVLNAREGWWQDRKRAWIALGLQAELGRGESMIGDGKSVMRDRTKWTHQSKAVQAEGAQRASPPDAAAAIEGQSRLAALRAKPRRKPDAIPGGQAATRHGGTRD